MFQFLIEEVRAVVEGRSKAQQIKGQRAMADKVRSAEHKRFAASRGSDRSKILRTDQNRSERIRRRADAGEKGDIHHPSKKKGHPVINVARDRETMGSTPSKHHYKHQGSVSPFRSRQDMRSFKFGKDGKLKTSPMPGAKHR